MRVPVHRPLLELPDREPACRALDDPLGAGQVVLLLALSPAERAELKRRPRLRAMLLEWFRGGGDRILVAEARRLLAPRPAAAGTVARHAGLRAGVPS